MTIIGETITVTYEESRKLRKQGWKPRNDVVVMMYVGQPDDGVRSNVAIASAIGGERKREKRWSKADHDFVNRKLAQEPHACDAIGG